MGKSWFRSPEKQEDRQKSSKGFLHSQYKWKVLEAPLNCGVLPMTRVIRCWLQCVTQQFTRYSKPKEMPKSFKQESQNLCLGIGLFLRNVFLSGLLMVLNICFQKQTKWWGKEKVVRCLGWWLGSFGKLVDTQRQWQKQEQRHQKTHTVCLRTNRKCKDANS